MNANTLEARMIEHCAPTLAGMKTASLFSYFYQEKHTVLKELEYINVILNERGVYVEALLWREESVLIYTYRYNQLEAEFCNPEIMELLGNYGYRIGSVEDNIDHLKERLKLCENFPHEIGAFLGYPPKDVIGFVKNKGSNCLCSGWWKVYHDAENAKKMFLKFDKCRELYKKLYLSGKTALQLAVAA